MKTRILALSACVLLVLAASGAHANLLSGYSHGDTITTLAGGASVVYPVTNNDPNAPDEAVAFDSNLTGTMDYDLEYNGGWSGGNIVTNYGNNPLGILMILPEDGWYQYNPYWTNDTASGGSITLNFSSNPLSSFGFSVVDVEGSEAPNWSVTLFDGSLFQTFSFTYLSTVRDTSIVWGGDNTANYITPITLAELTGFTKIDKVTIVYGGSGGIALGAPVPIPGAVWLLGSGLVALLGFQRRRRS